MASATPTSPTTASEARPPDAHPLGPRQPGDGLGESRPPEPATAAGLSHASLAQALLQAVRGALAAAPRFDPPPNLDLAVVALPRQGPPVWANVLFSREFAQGLVAPISGQAGPVQGVRFLADARGPDGTSLAWVAGTDWRDLPETLFAPLAGDGPQRFIAPYPASLIKLLVLVGVAHLVDLGRARWDEPWPHADAQGALAPTVAQWAEPMVVTSSNEATSALVALLHARGLIRRPGWQAGQPDSGRETANGLHDLLAANGLHTLRLSATKPDGGWLNRSGAGVGQLQMTAWDTVRLLWRLSEPVHGHGTDPAADPDPDAIAPPAPWLPAGAAPLLQPASRARVWRWLQGQALHEVLSSTLVAGRAGWRPGIPARLPKRWLRPDGSASAAGLLFPADVRPAQAAASCRFAHKTGTTASYISDAGRVLGLDAAHGRRYLIALQATLGSRHAPQPDLATDWALADIGAAVDAWLAARL